MVKIIVLLLGVIQTFLSYAQEPNPVLEVEVNNTSNINDDYLCWSPRMARVRVLNGKVLTSKTITLTIVDRPISKNSKGELFFQMYNGLQVSRDNYAPVDSIQLKISKNGSWTEFWVAGKNASQDDKDVLISLSNSNGVELAYMPVMVRVRKDARKLTLIEREKFLTAVRNIHNTNTFEKYWQVHKVAFNHDIHGLYRWPYTPLFLAWHRAFLLNFERDLQAFDPSISLPYWKFDEPSFLNSQSESQTIFSPSFLGGNDPLSISPLVVFNDTFSSNPNPWFNWRTGVSNKPLSRNRFPDKIDPITNIISGPISSLELVNNILTKENYKSVGGRIEYNYHNGAHSQVSGWLGQDSSPADPLFFLLHSNVDRAWAHWQSKKDAFDSSGIIPKSYHAVGSYSGENADYLNGSYALDQMWPWSPKIKGWPEGYYFQMPEGVNGNRDTSAPTPASQIDYLNLSGNVIPSGACYDDITYADSINP